MGRILGIDYGLSRIGLSLSDLTQTIASPLTVLQASKTSAETITLILETVKEHTIESIVIGLPLLLSGKDSETTQLVRAFATLLEEKSGLPVLLQDERLTSKEVERMLIASDMKRKKRKKHIDVLSATLILQTYLNKVCNSYSS